MVTCSICGREYTPKRRPRRGQKNYCSERCRKIGASENRKKSRWKKDARKQVVKERLRKYYPPLRHQYVRNLLRECVFLNSSSAAWELAAIKDLVKEGDKGALYAFEAASHMFFEADVRHSRPFTNPASSSAGEKRSSSASSPDSSSSTVA